MRLTSFTCVGVIAAALLTAPAHAQNVAAPTSPATGIASLQRSATLLNDINDVKRLQRIYGYYLDRSDWDNVVDLLTDDATAEYGNSGVYVGKASIKRLLYAIGYGRASLPKGLLREHMQFQPVVHVSEDGLTAKGRWRVFALLGQHGEYARWQAGPYENEYRKERGVWKISKIRWYETFTVPFEGGWKTQLTRANLGDRTMPNPDRPSTSDGKSWPQVSLPPYHYTRRQIGKPCCLPVADSVPVAAAKEPKPQELSARLETLRQDVQRLEDERDIETLQRTYGYYVDKNLWDQVADLFVEDGTLEIGGRGVFVGKKRVREYLKWLGQPVNGRLYDHTQLQPVVHVSPDGKTAKGRWRALIFTGEHNLNSVFGDAIYENEYRKEGTPGRSRNCMHGFSCTPCWIRGLGEERPSKHAAGKGYAAGSAADPHLRHVSRRAHRAQSLLESREGAAALPSGVEAEERQECRSVTGGRSSEERTGQYSPPVERARGRSGNREPAQRVWLLHR